MNIADKHFETVIRKMMCKVQITKSGDSEAAAGRIDRSAEIAGDQRGAHQRELANLRPARSVLLGITKAALSTESYLSAASFQHTIKVLAGAAIEEPG